MRTRRRSLVTLLLLGLAVDAAAAGPELTVSVACNTNQVGTGTTVTVPITFRAGSADSGQPNAVSAIDMVVTFASDAFAVADVRLPGPLASSGSWAVDWERSLGLLETPGRVRIALAPEVAFPVPTLPDGTVVELTLIAMANGQSRCVPVEIAADSVVLSRPPVGLAVAPGPITNGGVAITELCQNCVDDDSDGLIDLADPDCGAAPISFAAKPEKLTVIRKKNGTVLVKVRGSLPKAVGAVGRLRVELRPEGVTPPACPAVEEDVKCKGKKKKRCTFRQGALIVHPKKQRTMLVATLSRFEVPPGTRRLSLSAWVGAERFYASVPLKKTAPKGDTYR